MVGVVKSHLAVARFWGETAPLLEEGPGGGVLAGPFSLAPLPHLAVRSSAHGLPTPSQTAHGTCPGPVAQSRPTGWKAQPAAWVQGQVS